MIKTAWLMRDGKIDSRISCEWPEHVTNETIRILAAERGCGVPQMMALLLEDDVVLFLSQFNALRIRAHFNQLPRPYVWNTDEKPTDAALISYAERKQQD